MTEEKKPKFVFECQKTGRCCELRQNIEVFIEDIDRWAKEGTYTKAVTELQITTLPNGMPTGISIKKKEIDDKAICTFLVDKNCTIYNSRPIACVAYPLGYTGENYVLIDKECPGLNKGTMEKERLIEMRDAAKKVHEARRQMIRVLPIIHAEVVKLMVEASERVMDDLSEEEKEDIQKILSKKEEKKEEKKPEKKKPKKKNPQRKKKKKGKGKK